jgi:vancomycin permeability regulator SanA
MRFQINRKYNVKYRLQEIKLNSQKFYPAILKISLFALLIMGMAISLVVLSYQDKIYQDIQTVPNKQYAIVFGMGGADDGKSDQLLEDRAITAANLYRKGAVQRILISGKNTSETAIMRDILQKNAVPNFAILEDNTAQHTYETCRDAKKTFKINQAILVTQQYHLPRALYLCNSFDIDAVGLTADQNIYEQIRTLQIREYPAIIKAILNINIFRY